MTTLLNFKKGKIWTRYKLHCHYCGADHYTILWLLKLKLIFTNKIQYNCPVCHHHNCYVNQFHLVHDSTDEEAKLFNRNNRWDKRIR